MTGQLVLASEVRVASHGGARLKCTQGWLNERTPSGQRSLELLSEDDERYLAYIRAEAEDESGNKTFLPRTIYLYGISLCGIRM